MNPKFMVQLLCISQTSFSRNVADPKMAIQLFHSDDAERMHLAQDASRGVADPSMIPQEFRRDCADLWHIQHYASRNVADP